jgi:DNA-binding transcriptional MerR regulator
MSVSDESLFGSIAAAKAAGISLRQLYYWVDVLRVVAPQERQHGIRTFRRFTEADLKLLKDMRDLVKRGYTLQAAARLVKERGVAT